MKTIRVIDALNALANEDNPPKKIKYGDIEFKLTKRTHLGKNALCYRACSGGFDFELDITLRSPLLNNEVEIIEETILDDKEKKYLSYVIRPFRDKIMYIEKNEFDDREYIVINYFEPSDNYAGKFFDLSFPSFEKNTMYRNMELGKPYSLEELGL